MPRKSPAGSQSPKALSSKGARKRYRQVAALPMRRDERGRLRVLLVTSRDTGRWVMPKGWPMDGRDPWEAAAVEALEEAGAEGSIDASAVGTYAYGKRVSDEKTLPCEVTVYPMRVKRLRKRWKEAGERKRRWFGPVAAAKRVAEPELRDLLLGLAGGKGGNAPPALP